MATLLSQQTTLVVVALLLLLIILLTFIGIGLLFFRPWLRAFMSGCPISLIQIAGMRLRKVDPNEIIRLGIAATHGGHPISWRELEQACLQGVDLEKVTTAYVTARERGDNFTFEELVDAERESRLEAMLLRH